MSTDRFTEILNYLSAMSREMGEFRAENKKQLGEINLRLDTVEKRLDVIEKRLDAVETRLDGMDTRLSGVEKRLDHFEIVMRAKFDDVSSDIRRLHHKFENVQEDSMELRIEQRDQRKRIEELERKQA